MSDARARTASLNIETTCGSIAKCLCPGCIVRQSTRGARTERFDERRDSRDVTRDVARPRRPVLRKVAVVHPPGGNVPEARARHDDRRVRAGRVTFAKARKVGLHLPDGRVGEPCREWICERPVGRASHAKVRKGADGEAASGAVPEQSARVVVERSQAVVVLAPVNVLPYRHE